MEASLLTMHYANSAFLEVTPAGVIRQNFVSANDNVQAVTELNDANILTDIA